MPSSPPASRSLRPFWAPVVCALLSAALWLWSRQLPPSNWEKSGPVPPATPNLAPLAAEAPSPVLSPALTIPAASPVSANAAADPVTLTTQPGASSTPEPSPSAPTPQAPAPVLAEATPPPATPVPSPTPTDAELAGPLPQHTQEELAARASATPAPTLQIGEIAQNPKLWPKQVVLLVPVRFSVVGGNMQMPAGRVVVLRSVNADGTVQLELPGSPATQARVKAQATDLVARALQLAKTQN